MCRLPQVQILSLLAQLATVLRDDLRAYLPDLLPKFIAMLRYVLHKKLRLCCFYGTTGLLVCCSEEREERRI